MRDGWRRGREEDLRKKRQDLRPLILLTIKPEHPLLLLKAIQMPHTWSHIYPQPGTPLTDRLDTPSSIRVSIKSQTYPPVS